MKKGTVLAQEQVHGNEQRTWLINFTLVIQNGRKWKFLTFDSLEEAELARSDYFFPF